jgi:Protein of unknown function (DUF1203)
MDRAAMGNPFAERAVGRCQVLKLLRTRGEFAAGADGPLRQISVRAYDAHYMMLAAEVCPGGVVAAEIQRQFGNQQVAYIHLHNAKRGCFSCRVERA